MKDNFNEKLHLALENLKLELFLRQLQVAADAAGADSVDDDVCSFFRTLVGNGCPVEALIAAMSELSKNNDE